MSVPPWSATRARMFLECRRKYHYRYHLAPLARRPDPSPEACAAARVKDLVGLEAWTGDLVHAVIRNALSRWRAWREWGEADAVEYAARMLSRQFRDSREYWSAPAEEFPSRPVLLDMHYYPAPELSRERAAQIKEQVTGCVCAFFRSELARRIRAAGPSRWLPIDRNAAARLDDGLLVLVRPDFAFQEGRLLHIVDWKTGKADPFWEVIQVTCYALYAREKWRRSLDEIVPQIVYLYPEFRSAEVQYSPDTVSEVERFIRESQADILSLIGEDEAPPADRFPLLEDCRLCRWCQFRGLCEGARRDAKPG